MTFIQLDERHCMIVQTDLIQRKANLERSLLETLKGSSRQKFVIETERREYHLNKYRV